jgi:hypothetical protein
MTSDLLDIFWQQEGRSKMEGDFDDTRRRRRLLEASSFTVSLTVKEATAA